MHEQARQREKERLCGREQDRRSEMEGQSERKTVCAKEEKGKVDAFEL